MGSSAKQVAVAFALMLLIAVNFWFGPQHSGVTSVLYGGAGADNLLGPVLTPSGPSSTPAGPSSPGASSGAQPGSGIPA